MVRGGPRSKACKAHGFQTTVSVQEGKAPLQCRFTCAYCPATWTAKPAGNTCPTAVFHTRGATLFCLVGSSFGPTTVPLQSTQKAVEQWNTWQS